MSSPRNDVISAANAFSLKLYKRMREERKPGSPNLVVSPLSASALLSLTRTGAGGITKDQLDRALQLSIDNEKTAAGYKELLKELQINEDFLKLLCRNWLFVREGMKVEENFSTVAGDSYSAEIERTAFDKFWRSKTNRQVEKVTEGAIKHIVTQALISDATRLVLLNATYLKAGWVNPFPEWDTYCEEFYLNCENAVCVPTMHACFNINWGNIPGLDAKAYRLPYKGTPDAALDMLILLPNTVEGLYKLEKGLENLVLKDLTPNKDCVYVALPRVQMERTFEMKDHLEELGIVHLFDEDADLSGITSQTLYVDNFIQKTVLDLDENGTAVGAGTGEIINKDDEPMPRSSQSCIANHPFLIIVVKDDVILFVGSVLDPTR